MKLFKFLWAASEIATLYIIILSVINGIAGGMLLILFPDAALNIYSKGQYLFYAVTLPIVSMAFLVSKHMVQKKTEALVGRAMEEMVLRVTNTARHTELPEFELFNQQDIFISIADAQTVSNAAAKNMESFQAYMILFIGWLYITFFISPIFGLFLLGSRFLQILIQEMFGKIIFSFVREQFKEEKEVFTAFRNHLYGFKELKFNRKKSDDIFNNYLLPRIEAGKRLRVKSRRYGAELVLSGLLIHMMTMACCTYFSISFSPMDISKIIIILLFTLQIDMTINSAVHHVAEGNAALEQLRRLFDRDALKEADEDILTPSRKSIEDFHSITMDDIRFAYPSTNNGHGFSISIDNLTVKSGEILFIVGGNGSGKSTFMNVLTGLYPPDDGVVKIDGRPVSMKTCRHMFSAVFADFHLFDRLYGTDAVDEKRVSQLLRLTELEEKTRYDQDQFTTLDLSTGQRKRLALVIAMMEDRPVFVFDEWAADQDPHFRRYFYENILPALKEKGKTVIAITHDDRYFHIADKVIRMEYGRIAELWRPNREKPTHPFFSHTPVPLLAEKNSVEEISVEKTQHSSDDAIFRDDHDTGKKTKKQERKRIEEGMLEQLRQIFEQERDAVKKVFWLLPMLSLSMVSLAVILIHIPHQEQIPAIVFILFIFFLILLVMTFRRLQRIFHQAVENRIAALRIDVTDHARQTDLLTLKHVGTGRIYTALTSDIRTVAATSDIILYCFLGGTRMAMIYVYIGILYLPACIVMLLLTGIGATVYFSNHKKLIELFEKVRDQEKKLLDAVNHLIEGFKELKLSDEKSNDFYHRSLGHHASCLRKLKLQAVRYYANNASVTYGFWQAILLLMLLILPWLGLPPYILPVAVALVLTIPLQQVIDQYPQFHMAYLSIQRLFRFENRMKNLDREPVEAVSPDESDESEPGSYKSVRYDDISFTYPAQDNRPFSIGPLNISFSAGEIVFITGGNGSGKSTLLNLMTGLYPADTGQVFLNGGDETDIRLYRELFGPIFTDFHLFDGLYGMEEIDESKLNSLLKRFQLEKRVKWKDGRFSTLDLSTGQKKRLAMVITIMEDKPIFVLDEWAADQDPHFREFFYMTLLPEFKAEGKTVIAVTHDDMYFHTADRVLHLEYGRLD
ncbi:cyclic peptide export ABC transporter [Desulfobacterales bacterium HSG16]|nr:cyclic peptide export ABC transporter [Desulfobacterales bacterium HSG16]